ncbi:MAG: DUF4249 domain-containing protein [Chitinophagaceae bacterium]|nr:DUF4249 domain-containing protein [Chitinophagaceae bacterium]
MKKKLILAALILPAIFFSCREQFSPNLPSTGIGYLIAEGNLNPGNDSTVLRLTRSYSMQGRPLPLAELNATVIVEGSDGSSQPLLMTAAGYYTARRLNMSFTETYRVRIKTTDGKEYLTDAITPLSTPAIDSIGIKRNENGASFFVNAKGTEDQSKYYRWDYDETWEINSYYNSVLIYQEDQNIVRDRLPSELEFRCWKYDTSSTIQLGASTALSSNVISEKMLFSIPNSDERLAVRYSLMLRQYSMSRDAYNFYELMKKNTESLGTIFDPQPSELRGNLKCINDENAIAIGFITASTVSSKRIFVQLSDWTYPQICLLDSITPDSIADFFVGGGLVPIMAEYTPRGNVAFYVASPGPCVECTRRNGNLRRPSFW